MSGRLIASAALLARVACGGGGITIDPVASLTLSPTAASIAPGATLQLTVVTKDSAGNTLTARSEGKAASAVMTVAAATLPVATIAISRDTATLVPTQQLTLSAGAKDAGGNVLAGRRVVWAVSAGRAYEIGPTGTQFGVPATVRITYDTASVPATAVQRARAVGFATGATWVPIAGSSVETVARPIQAPTTQLTEFAGPVRFVGPDPDGLGGVAAVPELAGLNAPELSVARSKGTVGTRLCP